MQTIRLPNNWNPRPYQRPLWDYLERGGKRAVAVWHRRAGKDDVALHRTCIAAHERVGNYWYMLPQAVQSRRAIWEAINPHSGKRRIDEAFPGELRETTRENEMFIRLKSGSSWHVVGSDNYNSLIGSPPVGIVFSEWPLADPLAWAYLRPILAENGGWAIWNYTPRGNNHGLTTYENALTDEGSFAQKLTVKDTDMFDEVTLARERKQFIQDFGEESGEAFFQQEYYCSFSAPMVGSYYGKEFTYLDSEKRLAKVPWEPALQVHTAWDLGKGDNMAIWFAQFLGNEVRIIDFMQGSGVGLPSYVAQLRERPYVYGEHILPHDVGVTELGTETTRLATLNTLGLKNIRVLPNIAGSVREGINATRNLLPKCWFSAEKCEHGIKALRQYRREYDETRKVYHDVPFKDWTSHASDAFRYLAMGMPKDQKVKPLKYSNAGIV